MGDENNVVFIREMGMVPELANFHPSMIIPDKKAPRISNWVSLPDTAVIGMRNFYNDLPEGFTSIEELENLEM